jgi:hypothetical protein
MSGFVEGIDRSQSTFFPATLDDYVAEDNPIARYLAQLETADRRGDAGHQGGDVASAECNEGPKGGCRRPLMAREATCCSGVRLEWARAHGSGVPACRRSSRVKSAGGSLNVSYGLPVQPTALKPLSPSGRRPIPLVTLLPWQQAGAGLRQGRGTGQYRHAKDGEIVRTKIHFSLRSIWRETGN